MIGKSQSLRFSSFVTVIMPIRNEATFIERSLNAVLKQDYPAEHMEILVVDGMSDDGTREIVQRAIDVRQQAADNNSSSIVLLDNPSHHVSTALNIGLKQARGDVIIRVDGHCEIARNHVARCVAFLEKTEIDNIGGLACAIGYGLVGETIALAMNSHFGVGGVAFRTGITRAKYVDTVYLGAYRREVFEHIGGFDEEIVRNQDDEFNYRLRKMGGKILLVPEIRSRYHSRTSLRALWGQYFQYGLWKVRVFQKHPRQMRPRHFVPSAFVAAVPGSLLFVWLLPQGWLAPLLVLGSYGLANLTASFWTAYRRGWRYLPLLPLAFTTLHVSYGLGFLVGMVKFANRW